MHYLRLQRAKQIARKVFKNYHGNLPENIPVEIRHTFWPSVDAVAGTYRKVRKVCSAFCCGNPRKFFNEKTLQEKKADINEKEQIKQFSGKGRRN